jgi:hypothetical protein
MEKKENHQANIVRIEKIIEHTNADSLEIVVLGEYQAVVRKGQFRVGQQAVYIQPDSVVPQTDTFKFIWGPYFERPEICKHTVVNGATEMSAVISNIDTTTGVGFQVCSLCMRVDPYTVPEQYRRITVRRFRKEWSEGLLLPITDFPQELLKPVCVVYKEKGGDLSEIDDTCRFPDGTDVSDILGITHYESDEESTKGETVHAPKKKRKYPRTISGWFRYLWRKVWNFRNPTGGVQDTIDLGILTYDVRSSKHYADVFAEFEPVIVTEKVHGSNARYVYMDGEFYAGSRNLWKAPGSNCIFRKAPKKLSWIEDWCKAHPDYVLWGELTPTQKGYKYGSDEIQFFVFDVYGPDGKWLDESTPDGLEILTQLQPFMVPTLYKGPYNSKEHILSFVDGKSKVPGAINIREGVVVKSLTEGRHRSGRKQVKYVSNAFLEKDLKAA